MMKVRVDDDDEGTSNFLSIYMNLSLPNHIHNWLYNYQVYVLNVLIFAFNEVVIVTQTTMFP